MHEVCGNIKTLLADMQGKGLSSTAKLVAILESCGITDRAEIEAILECKSSTLREARRALKIQRQNSSGDGIPAPEIQRTAGNPAQTPEIQRSEQAPLACADKTTRANNELPTEVLSPRVEENNIITPTEIFELLAEAAGKALNPLAVNLQFVSEPLGWIAKGADINLDVIPVVRGLSSRRQAQSISSWAYYSQAVSNAVANRKRGLPEAKQIDDKPKSAKPTFHEVLAARIANEARAAA